MWRGRCLGRRGTLGPSPALLHKILVPLPFVDPGARLPHTNLCPWALPPVLAMASRSCQQLSCNALTFWLAAALSWDGLWTRAVCVWIHIGLPGWCLGPGQILSLYQPGLDPRL